jgi:Eukaryotic translation initiation factor 3 subunit 8 N-terminus
MLCHIYHHALHNDFLTARDMLLMSHLQEFIHSADVATQILYNRTVVQLGLCAFGCGLIQEAQATLQDIFTTQRVKELLAQGAHQQRFQVLTQCLSRSADYWTSLTGRYSLDLQRALEIISCRQVKHYRKVMSRFSPEYHHLEPDARISF